MLAVIKINCGVYSIHWGNWSIILSAPGDPPSDFRAAVLNSTAISLTWSEPLHPYGIITSYTITYNNSSGNQVSVIVNARDAWSYLISGLDEFTTHEIFINASTRIGSGPAAELAVTTNPSCRMFFMHTQINVSLKVIYVYLLPIILQTHMHHRKMCKWLWQEAEQLQ